MKAYAAEFVGTFWLVLGGCGSAVLAAAFPGRRHRSARRLARVRAHRADDGVRDRAHLRLPPESRRVGRPLGRRPLPGAEAPALRRRAGRWAAIVAGGVLYLIASGKAGFDVSRRLRLERLRRALAGRLLAVAALVTEVVMTMMFLVVILGATDRRAPAGFAPIAIGLCLTLIHLISIPVTNTSVNPARSTGRGRVRRRLGARAALALLGGADRRRRRSARPSIASSAAKRADASQLRGWSGSPLRSPRRSSRPRRRRRRAFGRTCHRRRRAGSGATCPAARASSA